MITKLTPTMDELDNALAMIKKNRPQAQISQDKNGTVYVVIPAAPPLETGKWASVAKRMHQENLLNGDKHKQAQALFREFRDYLS